MDHSGKQWKNHAKEPPCLDSTFAVVFLLLETLPPFENCKSERQFIGSKRGGGKTFVFGNWYTPSYSLLKIPLCFPG